MDEIKAHGFKKRNRVYYRIHGDGVLQCVKNVWHVRGSYHELFIGLQSMYSELRPMHFSSAGCHAVHSFNNALGKRSVSPWELKSGVYIYIYEPANIDPQMQSKVLADEVLPWMDGIDTHEKLAEALWQMDIAEYRIPIVNDAMKIAPFLRAGMYDKAKSVINAIINQNEDAFTSNKPRWSPEEQRRQRAMIDERQQQM